MYSEQRGYNLILNITLLCRASRIVRAAPNIAHENLFVIEDKCMMTNRVTKYVKGNFLGKGGFARCYEFRKQDSKELYAVKIIQKCNLTKPRSKQKVHVRSIQLISEIKIHESLKHNSIVEFKHTF
jgi:polo-like kinase 1